MKIRTTETKEGFENTTADYKGTPKVKDEENLRPAGRQENRE